MTYQLGGYGFKVFLTVIGLSLSSCLPVQKTSSAKFVVIPQLKDEIRAVFDLIEKSTIIRLCVGHVGATSDSSLAQKRAQWSKEALEAWIQALRSHPNWTHQQPLKVEVQSISGECPGSYDNLAAADFAINYYETIDLQVQSLCKTHINSRYMKAFHAYSSQICDLACNYSSADAYSRTIILSPKIGCENRSPSPKWSLHEFGHLFGLHDAYRSSLNAVGYSGPTPLSIMAYSADHITADDQQGLWTVYRWLREGILECGQGNQRQETLGKAQHALVCTTSKEYVKTKPHFEPDPSDNLEQKPSPSPSPPPQADPPSQVEMGSRYLCQPLPFRRCLIEKKNLGKRGLDDCLNDPNICANQNAQLPSGVSYIRCTRDLLARCYPWGGGGCINWSYQGVPACTGN